MNIQDRLAEAALDDHHIDCSRCHVEPAVVQVDVSGPTSNVIGIDYLCRACHTDYCWFIATPPEQPEPDISSGKIAGTEEDSDG